MSLRPEISGFSLNNMDALFGTKDEHLLTDLLCEFDKKITFRDPELTGQSHAILRRAIDERPRWPDLDMEGEPHVFAAIILAQHGQEHIKTDSNLWAMPSLWDFFRQHFSQIPSPGRKYLRMFFEGRGIFARNIETSWSFYGFLDHSELRMLLASLREFEDAEPAREGQPFRSEFFGKFTGWLTAIESNGKDLWFYCS